MKTEFPPCIEPRVSRVKLTPNRGNVKAICDLELFLFENHFLTIRYVKIIQQKGQRAYVRLPDRQGHNTTKWHPINICRDEGLKEEIKRVCLTAYFQAKGGE